jgi:hypothetical protein
MEKLKPISLRFNPPTVHNHIHNQPYIVHDVKNSVFKSINPLAIFLTYANTASQIAVLKELYSSDMIDKHVFQSLVFK